MKPFQRITMISPVGLEKERVLAGFKKFGITNVYIIQSEEKKGDEARLAYKVREFASDLTDNLKKIMNDVQIIDTNITSIDSCLGILRNIIDDEIKKSAEKIYINISTSSKIFAISAIYLAGLYPQITVPFYVKTSNYLIQDFIDVLNLENSLENKKKYKKVIKKLLNIKEDFEKYGWTKGTYEIVLVPSLPLKRFTRFQKRVFKNIIAHNNKLMLQELIDELKPDQMGDRSFRSKLSYALKDLMEYGILKKEKEGREVCLVITEIGEIFGRYLT